MLKENQIKKYKEELCKIINKMYKKYSFAKYTSCPFTNYNELTSKWMKIELK